MVAEACEIVGDPSLITSEARARAATFVYPTAADPQDIVVALSGGVDSAFVALYLSRLGHRVTGVTLRLAPDADPGQVPRSGRCCSADDMTDARQLCDAVGIPFYAIDARDRFYAEVFQPFVRAYENGATPIPCLACNHVVKFGDLMATAKKMGAKLATGHYVRTVDYKGSTAIARPEDRARDQSYYLYGTPHHEVDRLLFPLGGIDKPLARALLDDAGIAVSTKPDSQEICFVPDGDHGRVIERAGAKPKSGHVRTLDGQSLRAHDGVHRFTVGQRRGIGVGTGKKLYVVDVDGASGDVFVGEKPELLSRTLTCAPVRYAVEKSLWPERIEVQVRARHKAQPARYEHLEQAEGGGLRIVFDDAVESIAPGQAAVCYDGDVLLGGGLIVAREDGVRPRRLLPVVASGQAPLAPR